MSDPRRWDDLRPRILTGGALIAAGVLVISLGGTVFAATAALVTGIMVWELANMTQERSAVERVLLGVLCAACVLVAREVEGPPQAMSLIAPAAVGGFVLRKWGIVFGVYAFGITLAGFGLTEFRDVYGVVWLFWMVIVVAMTDIAGYFAGRIFGGPKFWPTISPKKTWSGIVAGWVCAVLVSFVFLAITDAGRDLIWISVLLSFASQMGDIAESAVKRTLGAKDSSNLLPGHGGLFDRFDGLLGAALFLLLTAMVVDVPDLRL